MGQITCRYMKSALKLLPGTTFGSQKHSKRSDFLSVFRLKLENSPYLHIFPNDIACFDFKHCNKIVKAYN